MELDIYAISDIYPNRNKTAFTKEGMELSKKTCYNKPILGRFDTILNDFDQHNGEDKYDKEFEMTYWDTSGPNAEKALGLIRESDDVEIVQYNGQNWLKISCALWTYYSYRQVKKLLKSKTKKVSVEILVKRAHMDENDIQVIDEFILTGITILGDKISEGIPGAHLNVLDLMGRKDFASQLKCLTFAYQKKDGNTHIISDQKSDLYNIDTLEGTNVTYQEKFNFLMSRLAKEYPCEDEPCFWLCDFSEDFVIIHDYKEEKYYKIGYALEENEGVVEVTFDLEGKVEQIPSFKDAVKSFVTIGEEEKNIEELFAMYNDVCKDINDLQAAYEALETEFNTYKEAAEAKVYSVTIDEVEYDVTALNDKYNADMAAKATELEEMAARLAEQEQLCDSVKADLCNLQAKVEQDEKDKLCGDGIALAEEEDELDDDDKEEIKEKCKAYSYKSLQEVEDDIARALYQKKKNNRSKNFKQNVPRNKINDDAKSIFDKI